MTAQMSVVAVEVLSVGIVKKRHEQKPTALLTMGHTGQRKTRFQE